MIKSQGKYKFTDIEKARIVRRRAESLKVRDIFDRWYKGLNLFPYRLYRSTSADYGPKHNAFVPVTDYTIIKYGLYATSNKSLLDMFKLDDSTIEDFLNILYARLSQRFFEPGTFRIKAVREQDQYKRITEDSYLQIIFVEDSNGTYQKVKGDEITILTVERKEQDLFGDEILM